MLKKMYLVTLAALLIAGCASVPKEPVTAVPPEPVPGWKVTENWAKLRRGMTQAEVSTILGKPDRVEFGRWLTNWRFGKKLDGPQVMFNSDSLQAEYWVGPR